MGSNYFLNDTPSFHTPSDGTSIRPGAREKYLKRAHVPVAQWPNDQPEPVIKALHYYKLNMWYFCGQRYNF